MDRFPVGSIFHLALLTGYECGTRLGETYGIDLLHDVDFDRHNITIQHQLKKEHGFWIYRKPKYNSVRTIRMTPVYEEALKREIKERKKNRLKYGEYYTKCYLGKDGTLLQAPASTDMVLPEIFPLCVRENGTPLNPDSFKYCARVIHNELGNPLFHSHCLRHTHGTILAENGAQPKTVMERLGHRDIKTTMDQYVFNTDKMQDDAVKLFEAAR